MVIGVAAVAGAVGLYAAMPASADHVDGVVIEDNPDCADIAPAGVTWTELKVEGPESGEFSDGTLTVDIEVDDTTDGPVFDWTSNIGVDAVIVKGGPDANVYFYDPVATADVGLHAPVNPNNDMFFGLSHISFCYVEDEVSPTTTPTTAPTTPTTTPTTSPTTPTTTPVAAPAKPVVAQPTFTG